MNNFFKSVNNVVSSQGMRQSMVVMGGNTLAQGLSAIALILVSRMLGPAAFGEFSVGFAIVLILSRLNDLGLTFAIHRFVPQATTHDDQNRLLSFSVKVKFLVALGLMGFGMVISGWLAEALRFENSRILVLAFVVNVATVVYEHLAAMLQALHRFAESVIANAIQAGTKLAGIGLLWIGGWLTPTISFVVYAGAPIVTALFAKRLLPKWVKISLWGNYDRELRLMKKMAGHSAIGFMAAGVIENIDVLIVQGYLNEYETGLYGGITKIDMLFSMFAYSLAQVLNPRVARYRERSHMDLFLRKALLIGGMSLVGFLVVWPTTRWLIHYTIGEAYVPAMTALVILLGQAFLTVATIPLMATFFAFPKTEWFFSISGILQLIMIVGLNWWLVPVQGIEGAAWARLGTRLGLFGFSLVALGFFYRRNYLAEGSTN
jgi:O-antigen/teichoic acid export membrane protein